MNLSEKQQIQLQNLRELLTYGNDKLAKIELKRKGTTLKKKLFFFMMAVTQSYAESILKIITPTNEHPALYDKSALILVRSMTENLINICYIHACDTQANAARYWIDYLQDTIKFANRYKSLMNKYPNAKFPDWDLSFGYGSTDPRNINKPEDWDKRIKKLEKQIKSGQKRYNLPPDAVLPRIQTRCVEHDNYLKVRNKLTSGNSLEKLYVTYYPYFSQIAHVTAPGLNTFIKEAPDGSIKADIDAPASEIEAIVPITYSAYLDILRFFLKRFNAYDAASIKKYKKVLKELNN